MRIHRGSAPIPTASGKKQAGEVREGEGGTLESIPTGKRPAAPVTAISPVYREDRVRLEGGRGSAKEGSGLNGGHPRTRTGSAHYLKGKKKKCGRPGRTQGIRETGEGKESGFVTKEMVHLPFPRRNTGDGTQKSKRKR